MSVILTDMCSCVIMLLHLWPKSITWFILYRLLNILVNILINIQVKIFFAIFFLYGSNFGWSFHDIAEYTWTKCLKSVTMCLFPDHSENNKLFLTWNLMDICICMCRCCLMINIYSLLGAVEAPIRYVCCKPASYINRLMLKLTVCLSRNAPEVEILSAHQFF